jgi:hypothetical protein
MTDIIPKPLTHVGPIPIAEVLRIVSHGFEKGWLKKTNAPTLAPGEDVYRFQNRIHRNEQGGKEPVDKYKKVVSIKA